MNKNLIKNLIILSMVVLIGQSQSFAISDMASDFTGDSFWGTPLVDENGKFLETDDDYEARIQEKNNNPSRTIPPIKLIRLKAKAYMIQRQEKKDIKLAPIVQEEEVIEPSTEVENIDKDNLRARQIREKKQQLAEQTQVSIDCKYMDYETESGVMHARDNVVISFPQENTTLSADIVDFDRNTNKIHAEGNVVIDRGGVKTYGESIDIDLNEESVLIAHPITQNSEIKIRAEQGFVQRNLIVQENGSIDVEGSMPISVRTSGGPDARQFMRTMYVPEENKVKVTEGKSKIFKIQAEEIIINSEDYLDVLKLKKAKITSGGKTVLKIPRVTIYSDKGHNFVEGNYPEIGSRRNLGAYLGPGFVIKLPKSSILKLIPALNYKNRIGIAGVARYWSPTNQTQVGYGTAKSKVVVRGQQKLDDNLKLIYASNDYTDDWFLGRRMPKYGADLIYSKLYSTNKLMPTDTWFGKKLPTSYEHRISAGYFQDMTSGGDKYYDRLSGNDIGTTRFRYMARLSQTLFEYSDLEHLFKANIRLNMEGSAAMYGTGDTQMVGRFGPNLHLQYKRWMQDLGYMQSAFHDDTPMPVFDAYRYGRSNVYLREYLRLCRFLTVAWQGSVTLSDDTYTKKKFQECSFYASLGPDDVKVNVGYDFVRETAFISLVLAMDTKGTTVDYGKMVIKNPDNFTKLRERNSELYRAAHVYSKVDKANGVLTRAVVEDIKEDFDDI